MTTIEVEYFGSMNGVNAWYDIGTRGAHHLIAVHNGLREDDHRIKVIDRDWPVHIMDVRPVHTNCIWRLNHHCVQGVGDRVQMQLVQGFVHHVEMTQWANFSCNPVIVSVELQRNGEFVVYANHRHRRVQNNAVTVSAVDILRFVSGDVAWEELCDTVPVIQSRFSLGHIIKKFFVSA